MKTVLFNGKIYVDKGHFEQALLQEDGVIKAVGSNEEILAMAGDAQQYDCQGKTVLPGLNDSHMHVLDFGSSLTMPNTAICKSAEDLVQSCLAFLKENPDCKAIITKGWNESNFDPDKSRLPDRHDMDRISTTIPIVLSRVCGHYAVVNTLALEMAGFGKNHTVPGGVVELEADGTPNGRINENAIGELMAFMPKLSPEDLAKCFEAGMQYAVAHGLTTLQCNDAETVAPPPDVFAALDIVYKRGKAPLRYVSQTGMTNLKDMKAFVEGPLHQQTFYDGLLKYGPIKMFKDGSLGARSALMRKPYADDANEIGVDRIPAEEQLAMFRYANEVGAQVVTHCIGDGAIDITLDLYRQAALQKGNPLRHSIIHYQITDEELLRRTKEDDILVAYQPVFLEYDLHICDDRVGKELGSTSYCFKTAYEMGIHASFGSDCPVEDCNPFSGIYCAVTRKDYNHLPEGGWNLQECISVEDAIDMYTVESAYHEFAETTKGRLKPGFLADLTVLDTDIFTCDPDIILDILPVMTMVGGKIVYTR